MCRCPARIRILDILFWRFGRRLKDVFSFISLGRRLGGRRVNYEYQIRQPLQGIRSRREAGKGKTGGSMVVIGGVDQTRFFISFWF